MANILVVDDEHGIRELLIEILDDEGHNVIAAQNAGEARAARVCARPDLVLLDIWMPDTDGVSLLKEWASNGQLDMPVIMMSGHATIETAVEATRIGALAFLEKPITMQKLLQAVDLGLNKGVAKAASAKPIAVASGVQNLAGQSAAHNSFQQDAAGNQQISPSGYSPHVVPLSASMQYFELDKPLREAREIFEREYLLAQITRFGGNVSRTASFVGMERSALHRKLKNLGVAGSTRGPDGEE